MFERAPLSLLSMLTMAGLVTMGVETLVGMQVAGVLVPMGVAVAAVPIVIGCLVATGARWLPAVGAFLGFVSLVVGSQNPIFVARLTHPDIGALFWLAYVQLVAGVVALVAGIAATRRILHATAAA